MSDIVVAYKLINATDEDLRYYQLIIENEIYQRSQIKEVI